MRKERSGKRENIRDKPSIYVNALWGSRATNCKGLHSRLSLENSLTHVFLKFFFFGGLFSLSGDSRGDGEMRLVKSFQLTSHPSFQHISKSQLFWLLYLCRTEFMIVAGTGRNVNSCVVFWAKHNRSIYLSTALEWQLRGFRGRQGRAVNYSHEQRG